MISRFTTTMLAGVMAIGCLAPLATAAHAAEPQPTPSTAPAASGQDKTVLPAPDKVLPRGWQSAHDRAVTVNGDVNGLHVLVADESAGYRWRTAATLSEPEYDADQWIGQACVTGSGDRAAVVYAPRTFTNSNEGMTGGGFVAIVDLRTGAVRKLAVRASLAYFNPGCGAGEQVTLSTMDATGEAATTVQLVDAATGATASKYAVPGEVTSTVPYAGGAVGVLGRSIVRLGAGGATTKLTDDEGVPFRLHPDSSGGVAYEVGAGDQVQVYRLAGGKRTHLGGGAKSALQLTGSAGRVFVLGPDRAKVAAKGLKGWAPVDAPVDADVSTTGTLAVTAVAPVKTAAPIAKAAPPVTITATVPQSKAPVSFEVRPFDARSEGSAAAPKVAAALASSNDTTDPDRGCAMARNDPAQQAYQASAEQVEWAADLAVHGNLTTTRPVNWNNAGNTSAYQIQGPNGLFKLHSLPNGATVPAQVLLGALAQESNTMHSSPHAVDGETGNFNQGGFYGNRVSWSTVDCGYGVGQVTTGMAVSDGTKVFTPQQQQAIATDYAANIAASLNMLIDKWNQLAALGIKANDGNPAYVENWYLAGWAYNTGLQPNADNGNTTGCSPSPTCTDGATHWGLGWLNNPANTIYPEDRPAFDGQNAYDTKHPNLWPYPEKMIGWAYRPVARFNYVGGYWNPAYAAALGETQVLAPTGTFCTTADQCVPGGAKDVNGKPGAGLCTLSNLHCWWHFPVKWLGGDCSTMGCATEKLTYFNGQAEPPRPRVYPADCGLAGLPAGARVIDDTYVTDPFRTCDTNSWQVGGSFGFNFAASTPAGCTSKCVTYQSKIDFHQIGGTGFNGHFWFTHSILSRDAAKLQVTGTWTLNPVNAWTRLFVHLPQIGAQTQQARYSINLPNGQKKYRVMPTSYEKESWVELGVYDMRGTGSPTVALSNVTQDGLSIDVAWDAIAYVPLAAKPANFVVALGDSYSSGEGTGSYYHVSDQYGNDDDLQNACRRSPNAWTRQVTLPGATQTIGQRADASDRTLAYTSVACSGALTYNVASSQYPWTDYGGLDPHGQYHEVSQLDQGVVDENTTMVLMTIGGNDAGFTDVLVSCMKGDCTGGEQSDINHISTEVVPRVNQLINEIHLIAPHALIVIPGYPHLFGLNADLNGCSSAIPAGCILAYSLGWALSSAEIAMLNRLSDYMMLHVLPQATRDNGGVLPLDMISPFEGHNVKGWGDGGWLNVLTAPNLNPNSGEPTASADFPVGFSSFHPTATGARDGYAAVATHVLASWFATS